MKAAFHYIVKAKVIRLTESNEPAFEEISKSFENENPIRAREEAFDFYQSWIDILLQNKQKKYVSDRETRKELISFIDPTVSTKLYSGDTEIEFNKNSLGYGIGVFFVPDIEIGVSYSGRIETGAELLIHGIGNFGRKYMLDDNVCILSSEAEYYQHFNYDTDNKEVDIVYCFRCCYDDGCEEDKIVDTRKILETPFDWDGYDKHYWWGYKLDWPINDLKPDEIISPATVTIENSAIEQIQAKAKPKSFEEIIQQGESNTVEFKPCLVYNFNTKKYSIGITEIIARTICAFLNSYGGFLFIGIKDNGSVQGLDFDYSQKNRENPKDYFQLEFDKMLERFLGFSNKSNIYGQFYELEKKEIFIVTVSPSKRKPIFLKTQDGKEFYVRGEGSTRPIIDVEKIIDYWIDRDRNNS